jgi:hypothetical protein
MSTDAPATKAPPPSGRPAARAGSRNRMLLYGLAIVALFGAMFPYTAWLNELKRRRELGEATIGQIDTGSFMLKLALLGGARGVAANVLWTRAIDLQKMHEWDKLSQTVELITKLQPHFLSIWTFQSWNLAYNVSVEWDDPADKYEWIKEGIKFVKRGVDNNQRSPDLMWDTAWTYYHKIGFADEAVILRKLFRDDTDQDFKLDPLALEKERIRVVRDDNFQLGYGWFTRSVNLVDRGAETIAGGVKASETALDADIQYVDRQAQRKGRPGDLAFRAMPAHAQTRYAIALEKASVKDTAPRFGRYAKGEWGRALAEWVQFGSYPFPAFSHPDQEVRIDLISRPEEYAKLTEPQKYWTERWSNDTNYRYWKDRSRAEGTDMGVTARQLFYEATLAFKAANFPEAVSKFREGLVLWKEVLDQHPNLRDDQLSQKDVAFLARRYVLALRQVGTPEPPKDMPFYDLWKLYGNEPMPVDPYDSLEVLGRATAAAADQPAR